MDTSYTDISDTYMVFNCFKFMFNENKSEFIPGPDFSSPPAQKSIPGPSGNPGDSQGALGRPRYPLRGGGGGAEKE